MGLRVPPPPAEQFSSRPGWMRHAVAFLSLLLVFQYVSAFVRAGGGVSNPSTNGASTLHRIAQSCCHPRGGGGGVTSGPLQ